MTDLVSGLRKAVGVGRWDRPRVAASPSPTTLFHASASQDELGAPDLVEGSLADAAPHDLAEGEVVLQHMVRIRDAEGREYVHATLRGELPAGERHATLYLGFCPPFPGRPQVEAELMEGPPAVARVVQSLHNGAQLEVELDAPVTEDSSVTIEVAAYEPDAGDHRSP